MAFRSPGRLAPSDAAPVHYAVLSVDGDMQGSRPSVFEAWIPDSATRPATFLRDVCTSSPERGRSDHLASGTAKSRIREIATIRSTPKFCVMKTNTLPMTPSETRSYAELQQQIHDALRVQHPEWIEANGDCPTCESYESRFAELLRLSSQTEHRSAA